MKARLLAPLLALSMTQVLLAASPVVSQGATYSIDPYHSKVGFGISHLVISTVEGRFNGFSGTVILNEKGEASSVIANIDPATIDTGIQKRDEHVKSADFLDVTTYPSISFVSKKITVQRKNKLKIVGDFTMHGVTKEVTLEGHYKGTVKDMMGDERLVADAETKLSRKDFGLLWNKAIEAGPIVGDAIDVSIQIEAVKNK